MHQSAKLCLSPKILHTISNTKRAIEVPIEHSNGKEEKCCL